MGKVKTKYTGKVLAQSNDDFDWSLYDNGYRGGDRLYVNPTVKTNNKHDKVYCHEAYAQELYDAYERSFNSSYTSAKDSLPGNVYTFTDIKPISDHEVSVDSPSGMSAVIDLNKEHQYLASIGCKSVDSFVKAIQLTDFKQSLLNLGVAGKVVKGGRISLWEGNLSKIEGEFMEQIKHPENSKYAYNAYVKEINGGGYLVDVMGVQCFLPGSLAAAGILTDFNVLLGKTIPVMVVNYLPNSGFVVSYKKYLSTILPERIKSDLSVGMEVNCKVTGTSKNGIFVQFKDKNGEWLFSGLIHRTTMSKDFETRFDRHEFRFSDEFHAYIHSIVENDGNYRIILGDKQPVITEE